MPQSDMNRARAIRESADRMRYLRPDNEPCMVTKVNGDGSVQARRGNWRDGLTINVPVSGSMSVAPTEGSSVYVGFENGSRQKPFFTGFGFGGGFGFDSVHLNNPIPVYLSGIWIQGAADELVSSGTVLLNGTWQPTSAGGPSTSEIQTYYAPSQFEQVLGVIAFKASDNNYYVAWLGNVNTGGSNYVMRLFVSYLGFGTAFQKDLSTHTQRADATQVDTGTCYGFLFFDRAYGVIHVLGSGIDQQKVWTIDPVSQAVIINGVDLGYSLHQSSVGAGYLVKGWQNRRSLSFSNDRGQQSSTFNFWGYQPARSGIDAHFASLGTLDPATLIPGYEIAVTRAKSVNGLDPSTEEGRCPINPVTREFITWISAWDVSSLSGVADIWMNNGFARSGIS